MQHIHRDAIWRGRNLTFRIAGIGGFGRGCVDDIAADVGQLDHIGSGECPGLGCIQLAVAVRVFASGRPGDALDLVVIYGYASQRNIAGIGHSEGVGYGLAHIGLGLVCRLVHGQRSGMQRIHGDAIWR